MFIVLNKQKIYSYLISIVTVCMLFAFASGINVNEKSIIASTTSKLLPIYNVITDENKVALTMNCAWNADDIDNILGTLEKNNVKITFFVVGEWVDKYPEAVKKIHAAGHEIANHSNKHPHVNKLSLEENISEIKQCSEKVKNLTGTETVLYRAPYGEYNNTVINAAKEGNHLAIQWNIDTVDYTGIEGQDMWQRLQDKIKSGSIILMHNGTKHTADSLEMLIKNINNKGLKIVKVSDLIYKENYIIDNNGAQKLVNV